MKHNTYTMCVSFEKNNKEIKTYEDVVAYSKTEAIDNINDKYVDDKDYLGCYVYDVELNTEDDHFCDEEHDLQMIGEWGE